jgi:serine/threonine protein kinase
MLTRGTRIGPYEIVATLGAGAMGEVYRAHDSTLGRDVAIKILSDGVSADAESLARFDREARMLASLNHPNIAAIHGVEQDGPLRALVLELVEGETLAARIRRGALPVTDALRIARDLSDALDAAHERGIIHRDLKPANIMLTRDDAVKVLDFGIARATTDDGARDVVATVTATGAGVIVGTPAFMSPEQMRGLAIDKRTDLWSLGCVLYEMLTGRLPFSGPTFSDTIGRVLETEPDWTALPQATPLNVRRLLERCLQKNPKERWRDAGDLHHALDDALRGFGSGARPPEDTAARRRSRWREGLAWAVAAIAVVGAGAAIRRAPSPPVVAQSVRFSVPPPAGTTFSFDGGAPWPSISPDGRQLAFVAVSSSGEQQLWVRALDRPDPHPVRGTAGAYRPFWSPDSRSLAYFADGRLWRVDLPDGTPQSLAAAPYSGDLKGAWGRDAIVMTLRTGFFRVPATGGAPTLLTGGVQRQEGQVDLDNLAFLPDGRRYLYLVNDRREGRKYSCVGSLDTTPHTCGIPLGAAARYADPGYVVFGQDGELRAQPFDAERGSLSGDARPIRDARIGQRESWYAMPFTISSTGVLAYHPSTGQTELAWFTRAGALDGRIASVETYGDARLSPDGEHVIFGRTNPATGDSDLWLYDIRRDRSRRFTFDSSVDPRAIFSGDGKRVVFRATRGNASGLYAKTVSGEGVESFLAPVHRSAIPRDWSSDNGFILYQALYPTTGWDLWAAPASGDGKPFPVIATEHGEREGRFAPGGLFVAYDSTESGRREIWVQPFPPTGAKWQISTTGGFSPRWRRDGKELFYVASDGRLMAVPVALGASVEFDAASPLFQTMHRETAYGAYDVSADGKRFLINMPPDASHTQPITIIVNWTDALR